MQKESTSLDLTKSQILRSSEALAKDTVEAESAFQSLIVIGKKLGL